MLEAHVRFELARWEEDRLEQTVREEVEAAFDWLAGISVADLLPAAQTAQAVAALVDDIPVTDEFVGFVVDLILAGRATLLESDTTVSQTVRTDDVHSVVDQLSEMDELRGRAIGAVTGSTAYHQLVAHVLYHGVKAFVLSENVLARKLPGAQSLIRLGQRGLNSAAPGLEDSVDRQLKRFVQNQVGETLTDSRRFLDHILTGETAHNLVDEMLGELGPRPIGTLVESAEDGDVEALAVTAAPLARHLLDSGIAAALVEPALERVLTAYGECEVTALLADFGVDADLVATHLTALAAPSVETARATGFLEERLRERLGAFYDSYPG